MVHLKIGFLFFFFKYDYCSIMIYYQFFWLLFERLIRGLIEVKILKTDSFKKLSKGRS
jgi:hypothetical protein